MWSTARQIAAGDVVIIWLTRDEVQHLTIAPGKEFNGKFGVYRHDDLVGIPYGSKVPSRNGRGYIHVLRPTPELWTLALPHRTQILYVADIAFISSWLSLKPGDVVVEAGTGSGSFSHSAARTIGPTGHLHSFEYHEERSKKARIEFTEHGMADYVTLSHRNVCKDGFGLDNAVDAVFLDLPAPWEAVQSAKIALKKNQTGRICCFSPCIEQVLRTVSALNEAGFTGITMYETLLRPQDVSTVSLPSIGHAVTKLRDAELLGEQRRLKQMANAKERESKKRKRTEGDPVDDKLAIASGDSPGLSKKHKVEQDVEATTMEEGELEAVSQSEATIVAPASNSTSSKPKIQQKQSAHLVSPLQVARPFTEVRGHTSYLTFAELLPFPSNNATQTTESAHKEFNQFLQGIPETELKALMAREAQTS